MKKPEIKKKSDMSEKKPEFCENTDLEEVNKLVAQGWVVIEVKSEIKPIRPKTWILRR